MVDKYKSGIMEGENNDWAPLTEDGYIQQEYDLAMIRQQIDGRVKTLPFEVDGYDGVDYVNVIFNDTPISVKAQAIIKAIKTIPEVKEAIFVKGEYSDKRNGVLRMEFLVDTVLGQVQYDLGLDEENKTVS
jgi:hypothetical protein